MSEFIRPDAETNARNPISTETGTDASADNEIAAESTLDGNNGTSSDTTDTFPREYVETLRKESAGYRERAKLADERAEALGRRLHRELVAATARLENPDDLPFDDDHLDDTTALTAALDALLADRPYLAKRTVTGDAGQGERGNADAPFSLLEALKGLR
ncbi:hypothetical protein [Mycolicibacterium neoaurum]|uniref:hypothetical protein n=1 Tax=Mycolicibacterium neoaurum TaxID=1795 RepID=UPI001F4CFDA0|nr:hypothetical protein [Mycolicibacterium neoaurum]